MRFFVCLLDPTCHGIGATVLRACESLPRAMGLEFAWQSFGHAAVLTAGDEPSGEPLVATDGDHVAVGSVRLDNREELERGAGSTRPGLTDLELALQAVARHGPAWISRLLGDFALVIWNGRSGDLVAATDPFSVRRLYHAERHGLLAFASRGEALAVGDRYEPRHLAELAAGGVLSRGLSPYEGVHHLPGGTLGVLQRGRFSTQVYWDPGHFEPDPALAAAPQRAAETCRDLLADGVRRRLSPDGRTWAQLSGGLDSSSVVSVTQWLAERGEIAGGLAGTVTYADLPGTESDERDFSDLVVGRWHLPNYTIVHAPLWVDGDTHPPRTDQPRNAFAMHPRERRLAALVESAGGRVLLSGFGGDELFTGTMLFFADWAAEGRITPAVREMAHRAIVGHVSFWDLSYRNAVLPLLPRSVHPWLLSDERAGVPWLRPAAVRQYGLRERSAATAAYRGPVGGKYRHALALTITEIASQFAAGVRPPPPARVVREAPGAEMDAT
jgi:asparagine synthase (glutamine-hydrolysing)